MWRLVARRQRHRTREESLLQAAEVAHVRAEAHLASSLNDTDHLDVKALHLAVADVAIFAIVVTFQSGWMWLIPAGPLAIAALYFFLVFKPRYWLTGPDPEYIFRHYRKRSPVQISRAVAEDLMKAVDTNDTLLEKKSDYLGLGYVFLGIGLGTTFVIAVIDRATS